MEILTYANIPKNNNRLLHLAIIFISKLEINVAISTSNNIIINIVTAENYNTNSEKQIKKEFEGTFDSDTNITFCYLENIPREANGKYRFSITKLKYPN